MPGQKHKIWANYFAVIWVIEVLYDVYAFTTYHCKGLSALKLYLKVNKIIRNSYSTVNYFHLFMLQRAGPLNTQHDHKR